MHRITLCGAIAYEPHTLRLSLDGLVRMYGGECGFRQAGDHLEVSIDADPAMVAPLCEVVVEFYVDWRRSRRVHACLAHALAETRSGCATVRPEEGSPFSMAS